MRFPAGGIVSPRLGALFFCAFVASAALTWLGCSEEDLSPIAPTPTTAATAPVDRGSSSEAKPNATVENGFQPQITVQVDGGFDPSVTPNAGFAGASGSPVMPTIVLDSGPAPLVPPIPGSNQAVPGTPSVGASSAFDDASPEAAVAQVNHDPAAAEGDGTAELKASKPVPVEPVNDLEIPEATPVLTVTNADGLFVDATFEYEFAIYKVVGGSRTEVDVANRVPGGNGSTSYRVTKRLDLATSYVWRARAFLDGAYGPWSEDASFRTAAIILGVPEPLAPIEGATVGIDTLFTVRNPRVEGGVVPVIVVLQVATDSGFTRDVVSGRTHVRDRGETDVRLNDVLAPATRYFWRARAIASAGSAREVVSAWSDTATFRTSAFRFDPPQPLLPRNGAVDVPIRPRPSNPQFTIRNARAVGHTGTVNLHVQVGLDARLARIVARGEGFQRSRGETNVWIDKALMRSTQYYWRVRATLAENPEIASDWSAVWSFTTTDTSQTGPTTAPGRGDCCPPPNRFDIVQAVVERTGSLYRQDTQQFTQRVAECLAAIDGDWGRRRNDSGTVGKDTVAYRTSQGPGRGPYSIDILLGASGDNPRPHWIVQSHDGIDGRVGGSWLAVDGSNCVLGSVAVR